MGKVGHDVFLESTPTALILFPYKEKKERNKGKKKQRKEDMRK